MARIDPHLAIGGLAARELEARAWHNVALGGGPACPDAELLAAYVDDGLSSDERDRLEAHLATCAACRRMLAVLVPADEPRAVPATVLRPVFRVDWKWLSMAAMVVLGAGLWYVVQTDLRAPVDRGAFQAAPADAPTAPVAATTERDDASRLALGAERARDAFAQPPAPPRATRPAGAPGAKAIVPAPKPTDEFSADSKRETKEQQRQLAAALAREQELKLAKRNEPAPIRVAQTASGPSQAQAPTSQVAANEQAPARPAETPSRMAEAVAPPAPTPAAPAPSPPAAQPATASGERARELQDRAAAPGREGSSVAGVVGARSDTGAFRSGFAVAGVVFADPERRMMWRIVEGSRLESSNDGTTWKERHRERSAGLVAGSAPAIDVAWAAGVRGLVLRYVVPGSWARVSKPSDETMASITASSADVARVTTVSGRMFETRDGGATWSPVP